jgi:hypothetical protein
MDELFDLRDVMFNEFGEDVVREKADEAEFSVDIFPDMLADETILDMFAEMINFIVEELAEIDVEKARKVLKSAGVSEKDINDLFDFQREY